MCRTAVASRAASASSLRCEACRGAVRQTRCSARYDGEPRRVSGRSSSPASTSAATATGRPATTCPGSCAKPAESPGSSAPRPPRSGDGGVLRGRARRYTVETYLRRVARAEGFNLTTDVIVGFPGEDERAFENTLSAVEAAGVTKVHVFPYSPRPGTRTAGADTVPPAVKKARSARLRAASEAACAKRWRDKVGSEDLVLVDRPGRGYGDDYSPWLVDAEGGRVVRARALAVATEGIVGV